MGASPAAQLARVERFALQTAAVHALDRAEHLWAKLGQLPMRLGKCCRVALGGNVVVNHSPSRQAASYRNLTTCGSVWACPVCASKISERRRSDLEAGIKAWEAKSGRVLLLTLTVPHTSGDRLPDLLGSLGLALRRMWSGKLAKKDAERWGLVGQVRALEVTHGRNGWHPHVHALLFLDPASTVQTRDLAPRLVTRWRTAAAAAGLLDLEDADRLAAFQLHAVDLVDGLRAGGYLTKMGLDADQSRRHGLAAEVTKASSKRARKASRTPFGLLADYLHDGDVESAELFAEYAAAFRGQRHLYYSSGLRELLDLGADKTDEEIAAEARGKDDVALVLLPLPVWRNVLRHQVRGQLLAVASSGDPERVWDFIASLTAYGSEPAPPEDYNWIARANE